MVSVPGQKLAGSSLRRSSFLVHIQRPEKIHVPAQTIRQEEFPLTCGKVRFFVLFRPLTGLVRATHIRESNLFYSFYQFKSFLIQKPPHRWYTYVYLIYPE